MDDLWTFLIWGYHDILSQVSYHCPPLTLPTTNLCSSKTQSEVQIYVQCTSSCMQWYQWPPAASLPSTTWVWGVPTPVALSGRLCQCTYTETRWRVVYSSAFPTLGWVKHMWSTNLVCVVRMSSSLCNQNYHTLNILCKWCWYWLKYHEERELFGWVHFVRVPVCGPWVFILPVAAIDSSYVAVRFSVIFMSSVRRGSPSFRELLRG